MSSSTTSHCRLDAITWRGFDALMLENAFLRAVVVPALGGKITSLVDLKSGREWLWRHAHAPVEAPRYGDDFVPRHDTGGFVECFPSHASTYYPTGPWAGTPVPDHGEIWSLPWRVDQFCDGAAVELRMAVHGVRFPYRFERVLLMTADAPSLRLAYTVTNLAPMPFPFLWNAHPVFQVSPGTRLMLPLRELTLSAGDARFGKFGRTLEWPEPTDESGESWDFATLPGADSRVLLELFARSPQLGYVALQDPALGCELRMQFDPAEVTHLGVVLNLGGGSTAGAATGDYNLVIAPSVGAPGDLATSYRHLGETGELPASGRVAWQLELVMR
ncbi:MAG TPA: hypothetical protein V6D47_02785 [Oscillatoriaceae cyanobacterium]